jgi:hypothetical protein
MTLNDQLGRAPIYVRLLNADGSEFVDPLGREPVVVQILSGDGTAKVDLTGVSAEILHLVDLQDVHIPTKTDGYVVAWDAGTGKFILVAAPSGGGGGGGSGDSISNGDGSVSVGSDGSIEADPAATKTLNIRSGFISGGPQTNEDGVFFRVASSNDNYDDTPTDAEYARADETYGRMVFNSIIVRYNIVLQEVDDNDHQATWSISPDHETGWLTFGSSNFFGAKLDTMVIRTFGASGSDGIGPVLKYLPQADPHVLGALWVDTEADFVVKQSQG